MAQHFEGKQFTVTRYCAGPSESVPHNHQRLQVITNRSGDVFTMTMKEARELIRLLVKAISRD
jgi:hypothetical protein